MRFGFVQCGQQPPARRPKAPQRGMTLVELLVVVAVLVTLMAVMVPLIQPNNEAREVREAARQLGVLITRAQTRAVQLGRPVGLWLERDPNATNASWRLWLCEVPPPYAGDVMDARVQIQIDQVGPTAVFSKATAFRVTPPFVNVGDKIRFNYTGPLYELAPYEPARPQQPVLDEPTQVTWRFRAASGTLSGMLPPPVPNTHGVPFQIFRRPSRSSATSLTLPQGTAIDLYWSGTESQFGTEFRGAEGVTEDLVLMFNTDGSVDHYYRYGETGTSFTPEGSIYFLVGRLDQIGVANPEGRTNVADTQSLWVVVNPRGTTVTSQNAGLATELSTAASVSNQLRYARQFARNQIPVGGA